MDFIFSIPMGVRLSLLALLGTLVGGQLNRAIYGLAWTSRRISPWSQPPEGWPPRTWRDRVPIVGWWTMRRESACHGRAFWVRPMLVELGTGIAFAGIYWLETEFLILWPTLVDVAPDASTGLAVHAQFLSHVVLVCLMIVATFIDFDEQTIPDWITVPGTIFGLLLAVAVPLAALPSLYDYPTLYETVLGPPRVHSLVLTSTTTDAHWLPGAGGPYSWPASLNQWPGLALGLIGVWIWSVAIMDLTWTTRRGLVKACQYMLASLFRRGRWQLLLLGAGLSIVVVLMWNIGGNRWQSLLSSIVGMCFGGGLIWGVRIVGGHALRTEAMGFGDVTLMAMIGAFLGWQATLLIFFMAPFTALVIAATQWLITGNRYIAFGPYLCLATLINLVFWDRLWNQWASPMFTLGWFIPVTVVGCLILMGIMLWCWRILREAFFY